MDLPAHPSSRRALASHVDLSAVHRIVSRPVYVVRLTITATPRFFRRSGLDQRPDHCPRGDRLSNVLVTRPRYLPRLRVSLGAPVTRLSSRAAGGDGLGVDWKM